MLRIPYTELVATLQRALLKLGFSPERAALCARLFAETTRDGVYSHGLNRFPRFVAMIRNGCIDIHAQPELRMSSGALSTCPRSMQTAGPRGRLTRLSCACNCLLAKTSASVIPAKRLCRHGKRI